MRYYLTIKTEPFGSWFQPQGWEWDDRQDAIDGARQADDLWMAVRLWDSDTGRQVGWKRATRSAR